jgi:hypothetical protein
MPSLTRLEIPKPPQRIAEAAYLAESRHAMEDECEPSALASLYVL